MTDNSFDFYDDVVEVSKPLQPLIDKAYALFKPYDLYDISAVCSYCCLSQSHKRELETVDIHYASQSAIFDYLGSAKDRSEGLVLEVKHLLPRMLELFAEGKQIRHDTEINFDALNLHQTDWWQPQEVELLESFAQAHFLNYINAKNWQKATEPLDSLIVMWDNAGMDISPLLETWQKNLSCPKAIVDFINLHDGYWQYKSANAFASGDVEAKIEAWLQSTSLKKSLEIEVNKTINQDTPIDKDTAYYWDRALWILDGYV